MNEHEKDLAFIAWVKAASWIELEDRLDVLERIHPGSRRSVSLIRYTWKLVLIEREIERRLYGR